MANEECSQLEQLSIKQKVYILYHHHCCGYGWYVDILASDSQPQDMPEVLKQSKYDDGWWYETNEEDAPFACGDYMGGAMEVWQKFNIKRLERWDSPEGDNDVKKQEYWNPAWVFERVDMETRFVNAKVYHVQGP